MTVGGRKLLLLCASTAAGLLLAELGLRLYSLLMPARMNILRPVPASLSLDDARLGVRPNPDFPDHDANGFRNVLVPPIASIVAMGDSQTYGMGVLRDEAWPHQLQFASGCDVYSIAFGGWGPTQSLLLFDMALAMRPRLIIEAHYFGNDLYDCFATVYYQGQLPELKTTDAAASLAIRDAERRQRLDLHFETLANPAMILPDEPPRFSVLANAKMFLWQHSLLYKLISRARARIRKRFLTKRRELEKERAQSWELEKRTAESLKATARWKILDSSAARTVLTPYYRFVAMDLEDPRIAEGHRIALQALQRMADRATAAGVDFLVLLIPTKELVCRDVVPDSLAADTDYHQVIEREELVRQNTIAFLRAHDVSFLDALPALRRSLAERVPPYPESADGHPNRDGHRVIAQLVLRELERRGLAAADP
jgi:lysophospholipase L1-like esterase